MLRYFIHVISSRELDVCYFLKDVSLTRIDIEISLLKMHFNPLKRLQIEKLKDLELKRAVSDYKMEISTGS